MSVPHGTTRFCPHIDGDQNFGSYRTASTASPVSDRPLQHAYVLKFIEKLGCLQRGQGEGYPGIMPYP